MNSKKIQRPSSMLMPEQNLQKDLEDFRRKALEYGASDAAIIPANYVSVDERVWMKCLVPRCRGLARGGSPYCPPNTPQPDFMRKVIKQYHKAVLIKRIIENLQDYVPPSEEKPEFGQKRSEVPEGYHRKTFEIVGRLESYIQSKGYYLALGLSGGSCRLQLCNGATCGVIENGTCRFPLQSRPSMEAVGIDVFDLGTKVGWDTYMIRRTEPDLSVIPCGVSIGIIFVF